MPERSHRAMPNDGDGRCLISPSMRADLAVLQTTIDGLSYVDSLSELKDIRDKAEAVRVYARQAKAGLEVQNKAAELKLRAERRAGEMLLGMSLRGGDRRSAHRNSRPTLDDIGITQSQSKRWQKEALVPESEFCRLVAMACERGVELTAAALLRFAARHAVEGSDEEGQYNHVVEIQSKAPACATADQRYPRELVGELINHCRLVDGILTPLYDAGDPGELHGGERRVLRRLMAELLEMLVDLQCHVSARDIEV